LTYHILLSCSTKDSPVKGFVFNTSAGRLCSTSSAIESFLVGCSVVAVFVCSRGVVSTSSKIDFFREYSFGVTVSASDTTSSGVTQRFVSSSFAISVIA